MTEKRFTDNGIEDIENQSFTDNLTGKTYWIDNGLDEIVGLLNELSDENKQLREENNLLKNSEAVTDQKELQKLIFGTIINLIDEKIEKYQSKPLLPIKMPVDCQYKQSCLHNQEINVCHKAKENAYRELKRELKE